MFITFEGIEGCGKTTQSKLLYEKLNEKNIPVVYSREPGGCDIGDKLRQILLNPKNLEIDQRCELFMYLAARSQHVKEVILPALEEKKVVIIDRFNDSTIAYQGYGRGMNIDLLISFCDYACYSVWPNITFLIDVPVELGLKRALSRNSMQKNCAETRFELESIEFHKKVRQGFIELSNRFKDRIIIINGEKKIDAVFSKVLDVVSQTLQIN